MLFDVQAALSEILASPPATPATFATNTPETPPLSRVSRLSQGESAEIKKAPVSQLSRVSQQVPGKTMSAEQYASAESREPCGNLGVRSDLRARVTTAGKSDLAPRPAIIRALRAGLITPGSIATATQLGATVTYQELDRMAQAGLVTMARDGALGLTGDDRSLPPL